MSTTKRQKAASAKGLLTSLTAGANAQADQGQADAKQEGQGQLQTPPESSPSNEAEAVQVERPAEEPLESPAQAGSPLSVQPSSTEAILDRPPLLQRITEALALVDRVDRLKLCEQLGVPVPEYNAAITMLVEAGAVKENAIDKTLYLVLTEEERREYKDDLATVKRNDRFTALSRIHAHRTYREEYRSWDEFLHHELCLDNPHDWWETEKRKVRIQRLMDERGLKLKVPLNKDMAKHLNRVRADAAVFVACVSEFQSLPENRQIAKRLGEIVDRHLDRKHRLASLRQFVPDATEEELAILAPINAADHKWRGWYPKHTAELQEQVRSSGRPERDCMLEIAQEIKAVPSDTVLLGVARGPELVPLVNELKKMKNQWEQEQKKKDEIEAWEKQGRRLGIYQPQEKQATKQAEGESKPDEGESRPHKDADEVQGQEEEGDSDAHDGQDEKEVDADSYDVGLTGEFARQGDHLTANTEELAEFLRDLADALDEGWIITQPSSLTVRPAVRQEQSA